ncbi:DUF4376 domain-containing protein [Bradyrhizobium barranii subsp. barranii]|uniref:DUF4376 domain-containing protein n=1 Tax=Bradyrhizobium barranii subsp. barranii TaxID=2823807 RepID=A0A939S814_9BRAD|nr:DUF4376 domain-containing protein [Bradyrhizobium barranii]UEM11979.1 DUF4376 domain-containing protein [Bradyrhizobium barranii subsp. barranii]
MRQFDIRDWYWFIGTDQSNVWSSLKAASVPISDEGYQAFVAGGNNAAPIEFADLRSMFAEHYPGGMLDTYTASKRWLKEQAGITLESDMPIKTDDRAQAKISGAYFAAQASSAVITPWHAADGAVYQLSATDIEQMNVELLTHINACFSVSADVLSGIEAGTITTREQIDAAFSAPMTQAQKDWLKKAG